MRDNFFSKRIYIVLGMFTLVFALFLGNLARLQLNRNNTDEEAAVSTVKVTVEAPRGEVVDRNGEPLVINRRGNSIVFDCSYFPTVKQVEQRVVIIDSLITLFENNGGEWIDELPLVFDESGNIVFVEDKSGDIAYLSKKARKMLDDAGYPDCKIVASNSLDEYIIRDLLIQGAKIDTFGVGERLVTSKSEPVFGGVYKLSAIEENGELVPRIKISENVGKITNPAHKAVWRLFDNETGKAIADVITLADEVIDNSKPYVIFDPIQTFKKKTVKNFTAKKLQEQIFRNGECIYPDYTADELKKYCETQLETIWDEVKRFENPHEYYVDLSQKLYDIKHSMLDKYFDN